MWLFADLFFFLTPTRFATVHRRHILHGFFFFNGIGFSDSCKYMIVLILTPSRFSKKCGKGQQHLFGSFNRWTGGERSSKSSVIRIKDGVRFKTLWNTWLYQGTLCKNVWLHFVFIDTTSQLLCNVVLLQIGLDTVDYRSLLFEFVICMLSQTHWRIRKKQHYVTFFHLTVTAWESSGGTVSCNRADGASVTEALWMSTLWMWAQTRKSTHLKKGPIWKKSWFLESHFPNRHWCYGGSDRPDLPSQSVAMWWVRNE